MCLCAKRRGRGLEGDVEKKREVYQNEFKEKTKKCMQKGKKYGDSGTVLRK